MEPFFRVGWHRFLSVMGGCALLALMLQGCSSNSEGATAGATASSKSGTGAQSGAASSQSGSAPVATSSDADLHKSFDQKKFDINQVPPDQRERVRAMMQQNAPSAPTGK